MRVALPDGNVLALFAGMMLAVTMYGLVLAAHFPAEHRRPELCGAVGGLVLWGTCAAVVLVALFAVRLALAELPGYAAVLAGGLAILAAPLALKPLPDTLLDGRAGLLLLALSALALAVLAARL